MKKVRLATQAEFGPTQRPAILRKDFIFDRLVEVICTVCVGILCCA